MTIKTTMLRDLSSRSRFRRQILIPLFSFALFLAACPQNVSASGAQAPQQATEQAPPPPDTDAAQGSSAPAYAQQNPEQLQQLVAPIALYPDSLVAQVLAASTFPDQIVEADRWVQVHPELKDQALGQAVDQQPWDPSVKALTAFPSVLGNMDKNLSWTSSLGDAYYNQQQEVMNAVQVMRQRAQQAGQLKDTPQQNVTSQGSDIVIQPADPQVVYVPAYDPWIVYGDPLLAWPGWYPYPGIWYGGPYLSFGTGFGIGYFGGFGWGWPHWGFDWGRHYPVFGNARYFSRSNTFYNRNAYYRGGGERGVQNNFQRGIANRGQASNGRGFNGPASDGRASGSRAFNGPSFDGNRNGNTNGNDRAARGYAEPRGQTGTRSGAFSGYGRGGDARSYSSRGSASFGGGGGFRGGGGAGGGFHGGGGGGGARGGGGRR